MAQIKMFSWTLVFVVYILQQTNGSNIIMESSGDFTPLITSSTRLRCARSAGSTNNFFHIATISITRGQGQDVASVTTYSDARGFVDQDNMNTTGLINNQQGHEVGYLEVVWTYPTQAQAADYKCEISGFSEHGHVLKFSESVTIDAIQPSMDSLVQAIHELKVEKEKGCSCGNGNLNVNNNNQDMISLHAENEILKLQFADLKTKTEKALDKALHIESGFNECDIDTEIEEDTFHTINFTKPYDKPPIVHVSMYGADLHIKGDKVLEPDYFVEVSEDSVTTTGFEINCFLHYLSYTNGSLFYSYLVFPRP